MTAQAPLAGRAVSGAVWITTEQVVVQVVSLLVFAILARFLGPAEFGLAAIAFVMVHTIKTIALDTIPTVIARKEKPGDIEYTTAFWITLAVGALAFAALQLLSLGMDRLFGAPGLGPVLRVMSIMLLVHSLGRTQEIWMQRNFHYRSLALRSGVGALTGGAVGVTAATLGFGVWALVAQQVATTLVAVALLWTTCPWHPTLAFSRTVAREITSFLSSMIGGSLAYAFNQNADTLLIGFFFGPASVGVYNVAKRLRLALQLIAATPVNGIALPALAEVQADPARFNLALLTAISVIFAVCGPIFLGAGAVGADTIALLFGPQWAAAAPIFAWLALGGLFAIVSEVHSNVFLIRGRPSWILGLAILNIAATLAVFAVMPTLPGAGIALPFVLPYVVCAPVSVALILRITGLTTTQWLRAAAIPLAAAAAMTILLDLAHPELAALSAPARLVAMIAGGALIYGAILLLLARNQATALVALVRRRAARQSTTEP